MIYKGLYPAVTINFDGVQKTDSTKTDSTAHKKVYSEKIHPILKDDKVTFFKTDDHSSIAQHYYFSFMLEQVFVSDTNYICYFEIMADKQDDVNKFLNDSTLKFEDVFPESQKGHFINYKPILEICRQYGVKVVCYDSAASVLNLDAQDRYMYDLLENKVNQSSFDKILSKIDSSKKVELWKSLETQLRLQGCIDINNNVVNSNFTTFGPSAFHSYRDEIVAVLKEVMLDKEPKKIVLIGASHNIDETKISSTSSTIEMGTDILDVDLNCKSIQGVDVPAPSMYRSDSSFFYLLFPDEECK